MNKKLAGVLFVLFFVCCLATALAAQVQPYASTLISLNTITIKSSGNTITADANISTKIMVEKLGFSYIQIQEKQGTQWVTVKSTSSQYKTNGMTHSYTLSYIGSAGNVYRATAGFYVLDGGVSESRSGASSSVGI